MNDRDSNTRAFKMNSHLSNRALRERKRKKRQIVLITLMALLALSLIISVVVICGELAGGGSGTGTGDGTDNISAGVISNGTGEAPTEAPVSSDDPVITDAPETSGGISEGYTVNTFTPHPYPSLSIFAAAAVQNGANRHRARRYTPIHARLR